MVLSYTLGLDGEGSALVAVVPIVRMNGSLVGLKRSRVDSADQLCPLLLRPCATKECIFSNKHSTQDRNQQKHKPIE